ncbi:MBL fold metallo-hydrolase [bacterium]|jgi:metallo-beta-lactamase family protein|nr:MBL fold metallo-hydrolase [bacterium]
MKLSFFGAAREVTGSKHLVTVNGKNILLDCGFFQGHREKAAKKNRDLMFDASKVDFVILSHAHIDHSGLLPLLVKEGFKGPIITTAATRELCTYMLQDSAMIQESDVAWLKKHNKDVVEPIYTLEDVMPTLNQMMTIPYNMSHEIAPGIKLRFLDAGHILGSAITVLEIEEEGVSYKLTFTGDLGRKGLPILRDPQTVTDSEILITESTYGNRFHEFIDDVDIYLEELINKTIARGGKIIIPAFALERTQEVVYFLHLLIKKGRIPKIPIYVDSPLATNVTTVFRAHPECFDQEIYDEFMSDKQNPFGFGMLKYTRSVEESKSLNHKNGPMVIISASGMCEFGRVVHHLKNNIEDPKNLILIVGYQAKHTLGRKIIEGEKSVKIHGEMFRVKAEVAVVDAFSAHSDRSDLMTFIANIKNLKKVFLVHGEESQAETLGDIITESHPKIDVFIPYRGESITVKPEDLA